jgi:flagellar protein FlbT
LRHHQCRSAARLLIEGKVPILREKDIMSLSRANSPAKRIYLAIQLMYTAKRPEDHHALYFRLVLSCAQRRARGLSSTVSTIES